MISIEDTASRVLAYSPSDDEVDELRRLSILGRQGPPQYLRMLREWGVYTRLRAGDTVVHVDEHPDLGIRRRLAIGIQSGSRPLGTIWVQQGSQPFAEHAERALLGAARVAAAHMVRNEVSATLRMRQNQLTGLLEGQIEAGAAAEALGIESGQPSVVLAFAAPEEDRTEHAKTELRGAKLAQLISVHMAAYRYDALTVTLGSRIYALLVGHDVDAIDTTLLDVTSETASSASQQVDARMQAAIGSVADRPECIVTSRQDADQVLDIIARDPDMHAARIADVRGEILLRETLVLLQQNEHLRDPRLATLHDYDARHGAELAPTLLAYLDAMGDAAAVARRFHVHVNTVRYRVRRASTVSGLRLDDPVARLMAQLQLHLPR